MTAGSKKFRIALTGDFYDEAGNTRVPDMGLQYLDDDPNAEYFAFEEHCPEIGVDQYGDANAVLVLAPKVTAASLGDATELLAIGRYGVGYDSVDVPACTEADVVLCISKGAVDRPVAEATFGWMIALTHNMHIKDRLVREGEWDVRTDYNGCEIRDRTFGAVGLGGISRETIRLLSGFGMNPPLAFDPFVSAEEAAELGVELVELSDLMRRADFVSIHCPLTDKTRNLIGEDEIALMKAGAYLMNTARGGIVNEDALYAALEQHKIAGAALDCFEVEPVVEPHRFGKLDNVMLAPHSIAWTVELFRDIGKTTCSAMLDLSKGREPNGIVNREVLERPGFQEKWKRLRVEG